MTDTVCPQWPDRCCLCMTKQCGVVFTGLISMIFDFAFIVTCAYTVYEPELWNAGKILIVAADTIKKTSPSTIKNSDHIFQLSITRET